MSTSISLSTSMPVPAKSAFPSTSIRFCDDRCAGHSSISSSPNYVLTREFYETISGRRGFIFEHLKRYAVELRDAQMDAPHNCFRLTSFCVSANETVWATVEGIKNAGIQREHAISLEGHLTYAFIARQIRMYTREYPGICSSTKEYYLGKLDETEKTWLTYAAWDHGSDNLCRIPGLERTLSFLSQEQRKAITRTEGASSTSLSEPMARSIVNTMHVATIVQYCVQVPALAGFPPGLLPLMASYVPNSIDDLSSSPVTRSYVVGIGVGGTRAPSLSINPPTGAPMQVIASSLA